MKKVEIETSDAKFFHLGLIFSFCTCQTSGTQVLSYVRLS